jgi:hypothetical protein
VKPEARGPIVLCASVLALFSACAGIVGDFDFQSTGGGASSASSASSGNGGAPTTVTAGTAGRSTATAGTGGTGGGGVCGAVGPKCSSGVACSNANACMSGYCYGTPKVCQPDSCSDGVKDGTETGVDCGGITCDALGKTCSIGAPCSTKDDCASGYCYPTSSMPNPVCQHDSCSDGIKDGTETDVDCGGTTCPHCALGKTCMVDTDCASNACDASSHACVADQCSDHRKDGTETDIDCGGSCPAKCALGQGCKGDADCTSNACDAQSLTCIANQCADHRQDGAETDIDCGGGVCPQCGGGKGCKSGSDCKSTVCAFNICG